MMYWYFSFLPELTPQLLFLTLSKLLSLPLKLSDNHHGVGFSKLLIIEFAATLL